MKQGIVHEVLKNGGNLVKTRNDRKLIVVDQDRKVLNPEGCSWLLDDKDSVLDNNVFRSRIEPWLASLFQSEHLSLLCEAGITKVISILVRAGSSTTMGGNSFNNYKGQIKPIVKVSAKSIGCENGNMNLTPNNKPPRLYFLWL